MTDTAPHSGSAEASVIGMLLAQPAVAPNVVGALLTGNDFYVAGLRLLFERIEENYYADDPIDALVVGEACAKPLSRLWDVSEKDVVKKVQALAAGQKQFASRKVTDHAEVVKKHSNWRHLIDLADTIKRQAGEEETDPDRIAADAAQRATEIATNSISTAEILSFADAGRRYINHLRKMKAAHEQGIEIGAKFDMSFIDDWTGGVQPTELLIAGGEPGVGKSAVWWLAGINFARRQAKKPKDQQISTLILSLEMGELPSSGRIAHTLTHMSGSRLREGNINEHDLKEVISRWNRDKDIPLYINHTSTLKASQLRALVVESIRLHNVGLVIIDHFRYFDMDHRLDTQLREDEEKVRFLKEELAKTLNIAVVCLAHTTKAIENTDKRPKLSHLRGSGQIAAHADFVGFVYRPWVYASQKAKDAGAVLETDAEMIWAKNRHGRTGTDEFFADFDKMQIDGKIYP